MTTYDKDKIIAAAKEAGFPEWENTDDPEFLKVIEKLYVVAFQSGTASRDAEIQRLQFALADSEALELGTAERCDQLRAKVETAKSVSELGHSLFAKQLIANDQLRAQINGLRKALLGAESALDESRNYPVTYDEVITALSSTLEQSLAEYRNKVIEAFVNEFSRHVGGDGEFWLHELQDFAMKEQP